MSVRDEARKLAKGLKESPEYKRFVETKETLEKDAQKFETTKDYLRKQMEIQSFQMLGNELSDEQIRAYNVLADTVMGIPEIANFLQAQMEFASVFKEVTDIMVEAVDLKLGLVDDDEDASCSP